MARCRGRLDHGPIPENSLAQILAVLDLARVPARDPPTDRHDQDLGAERGARNDHDTAVAVADVLGQCGRVVLAARILGVVGQELGAAQELDLVALAGGEEDDGGNGEAGDDDGDGPPEDGEVLGEAVALEEDGEEAGEAEEEVDAGGDVGGNLGDLVYVMKMGEKVVVDVNNNIEGISISWFLEIE